MIVYENNKDGTRNKTCFPEYLEMSREEFTEVYKNEVKRREKSKLPLNWVHSWYVDELQERIVGLAVAGNLEDIKKTLIEQEKDPQYLTTIRFCNDGFSTMKYEKTAAGPLDGYGLLNIAIFLGLQKWLNIWCMNAVLIQMNSVMQIQYGLQLCQLNSSKRHQALIE